MLTPKQIGTLRSDIAKLKATAADHTTTADTLTTTAASLEQLLQSAIAPGATVGKLTREEKKAAKTAAGGGKNNGRGTASRTAAPPAEGTRTGDSDRSGSARATLLERLALDALKGAGKKGLSVGDCLEAVAKVRESTTYGQISGALAALVSRKAIKVSSGKYRAPMVDGSDVPRRQQPAEAQSGARQDQAQA
jgi:hypothetical protein